MYCGPLLPTSNRALLWTGAISTWGATKQPRGWWQGRTQFAFIFSQGAWYNFGWSGSIKYVNKVDVTYAFMQGMILRHCLCMLTKVCNAIQARTFSPNTWRKSRLLFWGSEKFYCLGIMLSFTGMGSLMCWVHTGSYKVMCRIEM